MTTDKDKLKQAAAVAAAALLNDGMVVGLGSGTTATMLVSAIGDRVKQGLKITGIPTSEKTAAQARALNIPLATFADYAQLDVTIDGADEVELGTLNLIKGGGGNQLREKIVASASSKFIVIVDASKMVKKLGAHALPVEVAQFGWESTAHKLTQLGIKPDLRHHPDGQIFITDGGNYILDCACGVIEAAADLERELNATVGVMEHGLFLGMASKVIIGEPEGVKTLTAAT
jgi:ribose 5-phosphate isomerase A